MNIKQNLPWLLCIATALTFTLGFRHYSSAQAHPTLFTTEKAQRRSIVSMIQAKGILIPKETVTIGNLVNGIIRALYVQENDLVEEGQLLAEIDDSREDWDVNTNFSNLDAAQAILSYQYELLKRQQQLFLCKQISLDALQQAERDYEAAYGKVEQAKGLYEQAKLTYDNKQIHSPVSGMIIAKNVSVGQAVSNFSPAAAIYVIARNIKELKAHIFVDNAALEILEPNTAAQMTIETYPHKKFTGIIKEITEIPHEMELTDYTYARLIPKTEKPIHNCAIAPIDNSDLELRPGMIFIARITVAEKESVLSVPGQSFKISIHSIHKLAEELGYSYEPLDNKKLLDVAHSDSANTVWILRNKTFIEKAVKVGINDADFYEILEGLDGNEDVVYETRESHPAK